MQTHDGAHSSKLRQRWQFHFERVESSYEAEGSESDSHDIVDDIGYMPYRFEPYASESDESDSGDDNPPDDREIPLDLQRLNNVEWFVNYFITEFD